MKTIYRLIGCFCFFLVLWACEQKEIELYGSSRYLSFQEYKKDTLSFSFFFTLAEEYEYPIVVSLTGDLTEVDREFLIKVDTGTTLETGMYDLPKRFVFRKGHVTDTFNIKLKNHPRLKSEELFLRLRLDETEIFQSTNSARTDLVLSVTDIAIRPSWWDEQVIEWYYLGAYSRKKYELFMEVTGITDMSKLSDGDKRIACLKFKHWLADRDPIPDEENGGVISVPVIG